MAISSTDIVFRLSTTAGTAGDSTAGTANASLGKYVSTTVLTAGSNTLFDNISASEDAASTSDYRCVFVLNNHATLTLSNAVLYISQVAGGANITIATDNIAASAKGATTAQAATIANETTAPSGVSAFSAPTTSATGLALGNLAPGQVKAFWVKRTAANSGAFSGDGVTFSVYGETPA